MSPVAMVGTGTRASEPRGRSCRPTRAYIAPEVTRSTAANTAAKSPSMSTSRGRRTQRAVSAVQPDLDALIVVDLAQQLDHVVQIE